MGAWGSCARVRACGRACVRACVRAWCVCVRACVRVCVCVPVQYPVAYQESCKGKATFCQKAVPWAVETVSDSERETVSVHQSDDEF